jgi:hypothetical protein
MWEAEFMARMNALSANGLGAFSFHGYQHRGSSVAGVANMGAAGIDSSRNFFESFARLHSAANTSSQLWITETAWSASAPPNAQHGGAVADIDGMCRAADIAWNLDALGAVRRTHLFVCSPCSPKCVEFELVGVCLLVIGAGRGGRSGCVLSGDTGRGLA